MDRCSSSPFASKPFYAGRTQPSPYDRPNRGRQRMSDCDSTESLDKHPASCEWRQAKELAGDE